MSYATQSLLAQDQDFTARCYSCASVEIPVASETNPLAYVQENIWRLAASPGFDEKYDSAIASGIARPGWESTVITDADILSAMQALLSARPPGALR